MDTNLKEKAVAKEEEEYVFLDLTNACAQTDIPANTPYVLSGLDTENPILVIGNKLKLIGEYQETIGTCFIFSETVDSASRVQEQREPSNENSFASKSNVDPIQPTTKQVKPMCHLQKILKFRLLSEDDNNSAEAVWSCSTK